MWFILYIKQKKITVKSDILNLAKDEYKTSVNMKSCLIG